MHMSMLVGNNGKYLTPVELSQIANHTSNLVLMGVINVTPDSFSDGGLWQDPDKAVSHALEMVAAGAQVIDVGGESTRPGAASITVAEEIKRVIPVVENLAAAGVCVSVDTIHAEVAKAALAKGAQIINDVSGGKADPDMYKVISEAGCTYVAQHWRGDPATMNKRSSYTNVLVEVREHLEALVEEMLQNGIQKERIVLDPGFGFGKKAVHDWTLLANITHISSIGLPILVGTSRKRFLTGLVDANIAVETLKSIDVDLENAALDLSVQKKNSWQGKDNMFLRDLMTCATTTIAKGAGAWGVRVHNVEANVQAIKIMQEK